MNLKKNQLLVLYILSNNDNIRFFFEQCTSRVLYVMISVCFQATRLKLATKGPTYYFSYRTHIQGHSKVTSLRFVYIITMKYLFYFIKLKSTIMRDLVILNFKEWIRDVSKCTFLYVNEWRKHITVVYLLLYTNERELCNICT